MRCILSWRLVTITIIIYALLVVIAAFNMYELINPQFPTRTIGFNSLKIGMTKDQVYNHLGKPTVVKHFYDKEEWLYFHQNGTSNKVTFTTDGKIAKVMRDYWICLNR